MTTKEQLIDIIRTLPDAEPLIAAIETAIWDWYTAQPPHEALLLLAAVANRPETTHVEPDEPEHPAVETERKDPDQNTEVIRAAWAGSGDAISYLTLLERTGWPPELMRRVLARMVRDLLIAHNGKRRLEHRVYSNTDLKLPAPMAEAADDEPLPPAPAMPAPEVSYDDAPVAS